MEKLQLRILPVGAEDGIEHGNGLADAENVLDVRQIDHND
jgi:hypothetical protein